MYCVTVIAEVTELLLWMHTGCKGGPGEESEEGLSSRQRDGAETDGDFPWNRSWDR